MTHPDFFKRVAVILAVSIVLSLFPMPSSAEPGTGNNNQSVVETSETDVTSGKEPAETKPDETTVESGETSEEPEETSVEPEETSGEPEETSGEPEETTGEPEETTGEPEETSGESEETSGEPEETSGEPEETSGEPEETTGEPEETTGESEETTGEPEETTGEPEETTGEPEGTTGEPEETSGEPEETSGEPEESTKDPEETSGDPEETTGNPEETGGGPDETTIEPEETTSPPEIDSEGYIIGCDPFITAWGIEFDFRVYLVESRDTPGMIKLSFDNRIVEVGDYDVADGASIKSVRSGRIFTFAIEGGLPDGSPVAVFKLRTANSLAPGDHVFLESSAESEVGPLHIYEIGDVNTDGKINSRDATLVRQHTVGIVTLDDVRKIYADAYPDGAINTRDATLITQFAVMMEVTLGDRVMLTFLLGDGEELRTVRRGGTLDDIPDPGEGKKWSAAEDSFVLPDFTKITESARYYLIDDTDGDEG